jgi:hypothetical protein
MIVGADVARTVSKQKVVDELVQAHACVAFVADVPILDGLNRGEKLTFNAGLLVDLAQRRLFRFFAGIDKTFGKLPAPPLAGAKNGDLKRAAPAFKRPRRLRRSVGAMVASRASTADCALQFAIDPGERLRLVIRVQTARTR